MSAARTVMVTGAAKRVGRATALALAEVGCNLVLHFRSSEADAKKTRAAAIERAAASGFQIHVELMQADLDDLQAVERLGLRVANLCTAGLAGLVHNASTYSATPFGSITAEEALKHFRVNALAPLLLTQALAAPLRSARGAVVFLGDIHALGRPRRRFAPYLMSKAAVSNLVETLALELAPDVRVNGIAPGVVAWPEDSDPAEVSAYEARIPLKRPGTVEDAAELVRWLLFDATYVHGEIIRLDGGRSLQ
jgi:pteridine reductase